MSVADLFRSLRPGSEPGAAAPPDAPPGSASEDAPSRLDLAEALRAVIDPEVGMNIVDLGLLYDLRIEDGTATVRLTMTTPACPMSSYIERRVGAVLQRTPGLRRGIVELVWDPPWSPHMIDPDAHARLFGRRRPAAF